MMPYDVESMCCLRASSDDPTQPPDLTVFLFVFLGCDIVLPIKMLIPCLMDHLKDRQGLSADNKIEIEFSKSLERWSIASKNTRAKLSFTPGPWNYRLSLKLPADGGTFFLKLNTRYGKSRGLLGTWTETDNLEGQGTAYSEVC
jgi:hypothetical protein